MDAALLAALLVIDNVLTHEPPGPPHSPPLVRELLAKPLEAADAAALFARSVPALEFFPDAAPRPFAAVLADYLVELEAGRAELRIAVGREALDEAPILARLEEGLPSADQLLRIAATVDAPQLEAASRRLIGATLRFARAARVATEFPEQPQRFETPIGTVVIGGPGNDRHPPAALVVDPGGDDEYERRPATRGEVSVVVDLGGNDRYRGADVAVRGFSAIVDLAGDDRYEMASGAGAAAGGVALLADYAGNDRYSSRFYAQGAGALGWGILADLQGDDRYALTAWGQGFGAAGGAGLLWDRSGNDAYQARGIPDPYERGAGLSGAQGATLGFRSMLAGGTGILRDDAGNDSYEAQMFAQGLGYYHGVGLLWDRGGDDWYRAVRYAQGNGVHEAVGVLRDETGHDRYELTFGVGQGMGLDLALGVLHDAGGDDSYRGGLLVQGAATSNGVGILDDQRGRNRFAIGDDPHAASSLARSWGHAEWSGGLPSVGWLRYEDGVAEFNRPLPLRVRVDEKTPPEPQKCAGPDVAELREALASLRRDHFDAVLALGSGLRCSLRTGLVPWADAERILDGDPASPLALAIALAVPIEDKILGKLDAHPSCTVRAAALTARGSAAAAQKALASSCWKLQAAALALLRSLGAAPRPDAPLPPFLKPGP